MVNSWFNESWQTTKGCISFTCISHEYIDSLWKVPCVACGTDVPSTVIIIIIHINFCCITKDCIQMQMHILFFFCCQCLFFASSTSKNMYWYILYLISYSIEFHSLDLAFSLLLCHTYFSIFLWKIHIWKLYMYRLCKNRQKKKMYSCILWNAHKLPKQQMYIL